MITINMHLYSPFIRALSIDGCICSLVIARFNELHLGKFYTSRNSVCIVWYIVYTGQLQVACWARYTDKYLRKICLQGEVASDVVL